MDEQDNNDADQNGTDSNDSEGGQKKDEIKSSEPEQNPYAAPQSATKAPLYAARPKSPKVFGILSLVFAGFGLLSIVQLMILLLQGSPMANPMQLPSLGFLISNVIGFVTVLMLLAAGLGLVKYQDKGRRWFSWYAVVTVIFTILNSLFTYKAMMSFVMKGSDDPNMAGVAAVSLMLGIAVALAFPIIGYIMLNSDAVKRALH